jgi:hypothetical protein
VVRRRNVGAVGYLPRKPTLCPDCLRTPQIPVVRVSGHVPELLVAPLAEGAEIAEITPDIVATLTCTLVPQLHIAPPPCSSDDVE